MDPLLLAFAAGMVATVNPCGFAMLPAYLSYFLGLDDRSGDPRTGVLRALAVGASVSAGFLLVFFVLGVPLVGLTQSTGFGSRLPLITIVIGFALVALGVAMVRGFQPTIRLPKLQKGTGSRELPTMFVFGVSYAVSSLSCTIPTFLALVAGSFTTESFGEGLRSFVAYGAGMAIVLMALTLAIALARQGLVQRVRGALKHVHRVAGGLLVIAGLFLAYYGWNEQRVLSGDVRPTGGGLARAVTEWNDSLRSWIVDNDPRRIGIVLLAAILLAVIVATGWKTSTRSSR